jgi:probable rRNA maturation factor
MSEEPPSPSIEIAVVVRDRAWRTTLDEAAEIARRAAWAALRHGEGSEAGLTPRSAPQAGDPVAAELTVVLADDRMTRSLNRDYRRQDKATNVLSFAGLDGPPEAAPDTPRLLGDVILARETVFEEARAQDKAPGDHLAHLVVHGVLHLLGFDHETAGQAEIMESLECAALADLGIADPYRERQTIDSSGRELDPCHD